ncbi:uncharacterized protein [Excalfactoria chinensis]|uniref:uncharacterized protein n=1 Tax=Excalfactoria chinensis TaxID=46218 RepID=UPI003B3A8EF1
MFDTEEEESLTNSSSLLPPSDTEFNQGVRKDNQRLREENQILQQENRFLSVENKAYCQQNQLILRQNKALWEENRNLHEKYVSSSEEKHYEKWQEAFQLRFKARREEDRVLRVREMAFVMQDKARWEVLLAQWEEDKAKFLLKHSIGIEEEKKALCDEKNALTAQQLCLLRENKALHDDREVLYSQRKAILEEQNFLHEWYNILQEKK